MKAWKGLALTLIALAAALVPMPPALVERFYWQGAYLVFQPWLTRAGNAVPFALFDALIVAAAGGWAAAIALDLWRGARRSLMRLAGRAALRTIVVASGLYLAFLIVWGFNYRRPPLAGKLRFDEAAISDDGLRRLAEAASDRLNALYDRSRSPAIEASESQLAVSFARVQRDLGAARLATPGRPKRTLIDFYLRRAAVDGMTDPFFLETLVAGNLLPFERSFVVAHEWSHLAGYADEGEANFLGWLTCLRGNEADQYSGWLSLYGELVRATAPAARSALASRLDPGPTADRRAIADRFRRDVDPRVFAAGWEVYDRYLRANRVEAGTASYAEVVRLALGAQFGPGWTPLLR